MLGDEKQVQGVDLKINRHETKQEHFLKRRNITTSVLNQD
jgi:hypothetical protein